MRIVTNAIAVVWLLSTVAFVSIWFSQTEKLMLAIFFVLPPVMLSASLVVFRNLPSRVRRVHHAVVGTALIVGVVGFVWMVFFGREQSAVGAFLLLFSLGAGYVPFIIAIGIWSAVSRGRRGQET